MREQDRQWRFGWDAVFGILILLAGTESLWRGPMRFAQNASFNDFLSPYVQSRAWMEGSDPYSPQNLVQGWPKEADRPDFLTRDLADSSLLRKRGIPTAYPLTALVLILPVALLPWPVAHWMWLAISLTGYVVTILSVRSLAGLPWGSRRTYIFLAFALALAPFQTGLATGSIVIVAVAASTTALWADRHGYKATAGILLVVAIGLKPQIGLPFLLYCLLRQRWRTAAIGGAGVAILMAIAVFRLTISGTPWLQSYLNDNRVLFSYGSLGDFTEKDPIRFGLINLQLVTYAISGNRDWANLLALFVAGTMGVVWLFLLIRRGHQFDDLLPLSAIAVLSLLPVYHRLYDAALLILPLGWSLTALTGPARNFAKATLLILAVFLVPGGSALEKLQLAGYFVAVQHRWWWNTIVMPHEVWALFFLGIILLEAMRTGTDRSSANQGH
jgi:hypothetical protein